MRKPEDFDRQQLTDPIAPRTELEHLIAEIWARALGKDTFGIRDDFFGLGGQSLHVTSVIAELQRLTGVDIDIRAFFETPTIIGLADHVVEQFAAVQKSETCPSADDVGQTQHDETRATL